MNMALRQVEPAQSLFEILEKAVREQPRGRAFLEEFARRIRAQETDRILEAMSALRQAVAETHSTSNLDVLRRELETMAASIARTRREIASIKPTGPGQNRIVTATEELDHVLKSTEQATSEILGTAERLQEIAIQLRQDQAPASLCEELETHGTNLMMACSFQDLTGQRMTKVVNTLRYLETRVNAMIEIWGITAEESAIVAPPGPEEKPNGHLLNGPARDGEGVDQAEIDRLMTDAENLSPETTPAEQPAASQDEIDALFR
jgi:chemotaxis regulatin CheY-phosphate phosphatase CheZ